MYWATFLEEVTVSSSTESMNNENSCSSCLIV